MNAGDAAAFAAIAGTAAALVGAFIYALMEVGNAIDDRDWKTATKRTATLVFGFAGFQILTRSHFAVGTSYASLSVWDCLLLSPSGAGLAMGGHKIITGINTPSVVTTANPVVPEPALPADPPSDPNAYFGSMPRVSDSVRTSNTAHGHVKTAWNAKAEDTIDKNEAQVAKPKRARAKKPQTAHK